MKKLIRDIAENAEAAVNFLAVIAAILFLIWAGVLLYGVTFQ